MKPPEKLEEPRLRAQFADLTYWRESFQEPDLSSLDDSEDADNDSQYGDDYDEDDEGDNAPPKMTNVHLHDI